MAQGENAVHGPNARLQGFSGEHELERLNIISKGKVEVSTKGKEQLALWLGASA